MISQSFPMFARDNRIHYVADIKTMTGDEATIQGQNIGLFQDTAVIDTNGNGQADVYARENGSFVVFDVAEPALLTSYSALKQMARRNRTHIIRQDDVRPPKVGQPGFTVNKWIWDRDESGPHTKGVRALDSVIDEVGAFPRDAKWAIDTHADRFVIYSPGK